LRCAELEAENEKLRSELAKAHATNDRLLDFYEFAPTGFFSLDRDGIIIQLNLTGAALMGGSRMELAGSRFADRLAPCDRTGFVAFLTQIFSSGARASCELSIERKDRPPVPVAIEATLAPNRQECRAVVMDISTRKAIEEGLRHEKQFNSAILEYTVNGVVACDAEGRLAVFNRTARVWHGFGPENIPMSRWSERYNLFAADGKTPIPPGADPVARAFRGEILRDFEMVIRAKDQPPRKITANATPILDEQGKKLGAVAVMHDITPPEGLQD